MISGHGLVEAGRVVGDHPGEYVEAAGGAFWIGKPAHIGGQRQMLLNLGQINAAGFQHRAVAQVDGVQHEALDLLGGCSNGPRHKARPDAKGARAQPQIEAGGLHLTRQNWLCRRNRAGFDQRSDCLRWKNALSAHGSKICDFRPSEQPIRQVLP